jgi:hypothetical protein
VRLLIARVVAVREAYWRFAAVREADAYVNWCDKVEAEAVG